MFSRDSKLPAKVNNPDRASGVELSHLIYLGLREPCVPWTVPPRPVFHHSVMAVLTLRSQPKMGRINARRVVFSRAIMKDEFTMGNGTMVNNPRRNVCSDGYGFLIPSLANLSIPILIGPSCPQPAGISLTHLLPKAPSECHSKAQRKRRVLGAVVLAPLHRHKLCHALKVDSGRRVNTLLESQVFGPHASGRVAGIEYPESIVQFAVVNQPGEPTGGDIPASVSSPPNYAARVICTSRPEPATIGLPDLSKESVDDGERAAFSGQDRIGVKGEGVNAIAFSGDDDSFALHNQLFGCATLQGPCRARWSTPLLSPIPV